MRERWKGTTYDFGKTYFRNFYDLQKTYGITGAAALKMIKLLTKNAPSYEVTTDNIVGYKTETRYVRNSYGGVVYDENGQPKTEEVKIPIYEKKRIIGGVDFVNYLHNYSNGTPDCKVSFICTFMNELGLVGDDLYWEMREYMIHYENQDRYKEFAKRYKKVGAVITREIRKDEHRQEVFEYLSPLVLNEFVPAFKKRDDEKVTKIFCKIVKWLCERYNVKGYPVQCEEYLNL